MPDSPLKPCSWLSMALCLGLWLSPSAFKTAACLANSPAGPESTPVPADKSQVSDGLQPAYSRPASAPVLPPRRWGAVMSIGPDTIADMVAAVSAQVVNINATTNMNRQQLTRYKADPRSTDESARQLKKWFGIEVPPGESGDYMKVTGSGVIVRPDGYILTSLHVVENSIKVLVTLMDGRSFDGTVCARDRFSDLAMVKIEARDLPVVKFGNADQLRLGDWVIAIGNQFGLGHTVTQGLVSGLAREAKGFEKSFGARTGAVRFIQTDAPINPGSSGGPLLNLLGEVVGINTFIRDDAQNIGFAVPANVARDVADKLVAAGGIAHPYIGIVMRDPAQDPLQSENTLLVSGVEVTEVRTLSPASRAGIEPGDVIMEIDQRPVRRSDDVSQAVGSRHIGESLKLKIKRSGGERIVTLKIDQLPDGPD